MQLTRKFNKGNKFLLCFIGIFSKYALVVPLKDKIGITIANAFWKILDNLTRKSNKIWVDKSSEFYNSFFFKKDNDIEIYSTHNEEKSVVTERFFRTLKNNLQEYDSCIKKCVYW